MNNDTKFLDLPSLVGDLFTHHDLQIDNLFATLWTKIHISTLLQRAGFHKRSGVEVAQVVYLLLLWVWLKTESISMFSREAMQSFTDAKKDVMYDYLKREDVNWRRLHCQVAQQVVMEHKLNTQTIKAFVLDDSVKIRRGKKMAGVSSHFDHLTGRTVMGQQVLTLGYATEEMFLPLDNQIYISQKKIQEQEQDFHDGRSIVAKRYRESLAMSKPEMAANMVNRALTKGFAADYLLADAWFGNKTTLRLTQATDLTAILRMKKDKTLYRYSYYAKGEQHTVMANAKDLYSHHVRKQWHKIQETKYRCKVLDVELNLTSSAKEEAQWVSYRLLFVKGTTGDDTEIPGKHDWALFLTTDTSMEPSQILEIYALRWSIEVYFKESKRHLGLLKEQTNSFASHIASTHLAAIRFCMLIYAKQEGTGLTASAIRNKMVEGLVNLSFAKQLWMLFRALIYNGLTGIKRQLGCSVGLVMDSIEEYINHFFVQALQLDPFTLEQEALNQGEP
ncbi:MAG: transposase [Methylococcales bacterium]|nr:transposase [Methylococcales bacterium]